MIANNLLWLALLVFLAVKGFYGIRRSMKLAVVTLVAALAVLFLLHGSNFARGDLVSFAQALLMIWLAAIGIHNVWREWRGF